MSMKKHAAVFTSMIAVLSVSGAVFASPALPKLTADEAAVAYHVNHDQQIVTNASTSSGDPSVEIIDHNPSSYQKEELAGHEVESWVEDGTAYSKLDGQLTKSYKINGDVEQIVQMDNDGENIITIDHNPTSYQKMMVGNHVLESWVEDGTAYSRMDGKITKAYKINGDLETVSYGDDNDSRIVLDHNPQSYTKTEIAGHSAEGWMKHGTAYTRAVE